MDTQEQELMEEAQKLRIFVNEIYPSPEDRVQYWANFDKKLRTALARTLYLLATPDDQKELDKLSSEINLYDFTAIVENEMDQNSDFGEEIHATIHDLITSELATLNTK